MNFSSLANLYNIKSFRMSVIIDETIIQIQRNSCKNHKESNTYKNLTKTIFLAVHFRSAILTTDSCLLKIQFDLFC